MTDNGACSKSEQYVQRRNQEIKAISQYMDMQSRNPYQDGSLSIIELFRVSHVSRWGIVRTARPQNVAEHSMRVYLLTSRLCRSLKVNYRVSFLAEKLALHHDIPEVRTGDIPTPTKKGLNIKDDGIHPELDSLMNIINGCGSKSSFIKLIVKVADLVEAAYFLSIEKMDEHGSMVEYGLWKAAVDLLKTGINDNPQYNWGDGLAIIQSLAGNHYDVMAQMGGIANAKK